MSGKLIMKRKLDKKDQLSADNNKFEIEESSVSTLATSSTSIVDKQIGNSKETFMKQPENKRIRCETPPPEPEELDLHSLPQSSRQNRHLLEAIQLKMLELQSELDAFEQDVEAHEEDYYYQNDNRHNHENNQMSEEDAEALGFAMCAQETMLFLQREGISSNSLLYSRLRDALVRRAEKDRTLHT